MSSSPEMTPMMDPRTQAKMAPMYTIDQILGHNTPGEQRIHQDQDTLPSPNIKGEMVSIYSYLLFRTEALRLDS